jgi:putative CocE/NonD family hydrolase
VALEAPTSEFTSEPAHPLQDPYSEFGARDYQKLAGRDDVLVFDSFPFDKDTEVTGPIQATIYASADVADFDLWVRALDVWPDGRAFNLMSPGLDVLRASYRNGSQKPELLAPENIYELKLDRLLTSNVFKAGHQLRIQISGAFSPHFSRNLQMGESEITSSKTKIGHIRIYHDNDHLSTVTVPIVPRER